MGVTADEHKGTLDETLEEMMQGPQRRDGDKEEAEAVDLLPIVDSVFGQVGAALPGVRLRSVSVLVCRAHQVLRLIGCLRSGFH